MLYIIPACEKIFGISHDLLYQDPTSWLELVPYQDHKSLKQAEAEMLSSLDKEQELNESSLVLSL